MSELIPLRAGLLEMEFDPAATFLRYVRVGSHELVRGIYAAVRDETWGTYPCRLVSLDRRIEADRFALRWRSVTPALQWDGELTGTASGIVTYRVKGTAIEGFSTARTGICLLHPVKECRGLPCRITHADGAVEEGSFPNCISPHQPFREIRAMAYAGPGGSLLRINFDGEIFETEDQRNWSDASFKTYCRPLGLPWPYRIEAGDSIQQSVEISFAAPGDFVPSTVTSVAAVNTGEGTGVLPKIGAMLAQPGRLKEWQAERLREIGFDHVGVAIDLSTPGWMERLSLAADVGIPLEIHLTGFEDDLNLEALVRSLGPLTVARVLLIPGGDGRSFADIVERLDTAVPVFATTPDDFAALNRNPPIMDGLSGVGFALNPQVHTLDNLSIMETTEMHSELTQDARALAKGKAVAVGPITLEPRHWRDRQADSRLHSPFGAAWTLASLASLTAVKADSATYFETHGPRGILSDDPTRPGLLEQMIGSVLSLKGHQIYETTVNLPRKVAALLAQTPTGIQGVLANLCDQETRARWEGQEYRLGPYEQVTVCE